MARVLVVDDEPDFVWVIAALLEGEGHIVAVAGNGDEAWRLIQARTFDLVVSDVQMPVLDGAGLLGRFAADAARDHPPAVFMSALSRDKALSLLGRSYPFLQKPFSVEDLVRAVRMHAA